MNSRDEEARGAPAGSRWQRTALAFALAAKAAPGALLAYVALTLVSGALPVATAWLTKVTLDGLVGGAELRTVLVPGIGLSLVGVCGGLVPQVTHYVRTQLERETGLLGQERLFQAVERFVGLGRFEDPRFLDRLRLAQQASSVTANQAVEGTLGSARAAFTIISFLGSLFLLNPVLTVLVLAAGVPMLLAELALSRRRARMLWRIGPTERRELFYSDLLASVEAAKEVRLFGIGAFLRERMLVERRAANTAKRAVDLREVVTQSGLGLLAALVSGGGLLWAIWAASAGMLSVGDITMLVAAVAGVQGALTQLAREVARTHQALLMFGHYVAVVTCGPDLPVVAVPRPLPALRSGIELRDVWFRYSDAHPWVLRGVNLHIPFGKTTALIGLNGAGKSTLVKLLCRFYDPTRGAVLWDGVDIRDVDVAALRRRISAVFQDYMEYDMTAAENIALGDVTKLDDQEWIRSSAMRAGIHDKLADLPKGYDTVLSRMFLMESDEEGGRTGVVLSGGQWQRLALARAFFRDRRDLVILDEPSAGLDAVAEYEIHTSLKRHREGRTSVLISHRLGAVRNADRIVVLSEGRVIEEGDHHALTRDGGEYARLFALQASGYGTDADGQTTYSGSL
ncbi:multidrug ABC transporter permease [Streptomyces griseoloalbus]|uniref:ABC transporter ATP-binding protein n=1 Tax=Streptomyces griseoloalbus TaxID=67303 RepID=UPI0018739740|nr:multidrug ABC transporter permease [Streptomyces griseoloalbus]